MRSLPLAQLVSKRVRIEVLKLPGAVSSGARMIGAMFSEA